jgi:uncharacterized surface protein with fasciclin (FAS1) repeats
MKAKLPQPLLIVAQLLLQSSLLTMAVGAQEKAGRAGEKSTTTSSSSKTAVEEITCAADLTIAGCITSAAKRGKFTTFAKLAKVSGLEGVLNDSGPYTVFVPTDEAFSALGPGKVEELLEPANRERLRAILYLHAIRGNILMKEVSQLSGSGATAVSLQGMWLGVAKEGEVNGARILKADIAASNGTIHIIDSVILPDSGPHAAGPPPPEVVPAAPATQQRTRDRVVKLYSWPNEPVKIVAVKLRGGEQINPGIPFRAVDDWVRGLTLTVTNVSKKPVCFIHVELHLPRPDDATGEAANDALMFACDPVTALTPNPLMPGKSMDMVLTDSDYVAHEALLERYGYPPSVINLELKVREVEFFGEKDRKWSKGQMMRQDPNSPGDWHPEGQSVSNWFYRGRIACDHLEIHSSKE